LADKTASYFCWLLFLPFDDSFPFYIRRLKMSWLFFDNSQ